MASNLVNAHIGEQKLDPHGHRYAELNGYDAYRHIREQPWADGILLIALTGWGQEEDRQKSKDAGFNEHWVKPIDHVASTNLLENS